MANSGRFGINDEQAEPLVTAVRFGPRGDDEEIGDVGVGDVNLLPGDDVVVAITHGARLDRRGVRAA